MSSKMGDGMQLITSRKEKALIVSLLVIGAIPISLMALNVYQFYHTDIGLNYELIRIIDFIEIPGLVALGIVIGLVIPKLRSKDDTLKG